jgi:hypothetical protein
MTGIAADDGPRDAGEINVANGTQELLERNEEDRKRSRCRWSRRRPG